MSRPGRINLQKTSEPDQLKPEKVSDNFFLKFRDKQSNKFSKFTANQFLDVWKHFDTDGKLIQYRSFMSINFR